MKLKALVAAVALAAAGTAMADTTQNLGDMGPPGAALFGNWFTSGQSFTDTYTFSIDSGANGVGGVFDFDLSWGMHIDLTSVSLTGGGLSSALVDNTPLSFSFGSLAAGTYSLIVKGVASGNSLGWFDPLGVGYKGTLVTTPTQVSAPVPEPETIAMMALGLGVMGFVARRRKQLGK